MLSHRITTVVAPAGYGKSVWVSSLLDEPHWPLTAWLNLEQHDAEPSNLLYDLIYAIKRVLPDFGEKLLLTVTSLESVIRDWTIAITIFLEELPQDQKLVLVLDDVHFIHESTVACAIIERILRLMPDNIYLVLLGRSSLPIKLYNQQLGGNLLEIQGSQLLFTLEEARSLLSLMELTLTANETAAMHAWTEGWAVGLRLAGIYIKQSGNDPDKVIRVSRQEDSSLYQYLSNELLGTLPERMKDFLLNASLLPYLETELCNAAFQCTDSSTMLEKLHNYSLLSRVEGQPVTWRIHHLIGDYLADKAIKFWQPEHISDIRSRAGAFFEAKGDIERAIEQAVACTDWTRAADLIHNYGYEYFMRTARLDALQKWIEQLPEDQVEGDHWLLYFKGRSIIQIDDNEAMAILSASAEMAVQKGDVKCEACCLLAMISSAVFNGDLNKEKEVGQRLLSKPSLLKDPQSREAALTGALWHVMFVDDLQQGLKLSRTALRLKLGPEFRINALFISAFIHCRAGNLSHARQLIEEALSVPFIRENELSTAFAYVLLTVILYLAGDDAALEETCGKLQHIAEKYNMVIHLGRVHYHRAHICYHEGRYAEGRREFELARNYFVEGGSISFPNIAALGNMPLRIRTGENAKDLLGETKDLLNKLEAFPYGQGYDYFIFSFGGIVAMEAGELDLARELIEKSIGRWLENGSKYNLAGTSFLLSYVYLLQGKESTADSYLRKALSLAEDGQWINFWEWHDETFFTMCRRAVLKNIHAGYAARLLSKWFPSRCCRELGWMLLLPDEQMPAFASSLFHDMAHKAGTMFYMHFFWEDSAFL
jgi:ATP-dependent transcriptional regulator